MGTPGFELPAPTVHEVNCRAKPGYTSKTLAREGGQRVQRNYGAGPLWVYECPHCHRWHLTSAPQKAASANVKFTPRKKT